MTGSWKGRGNQYIQFIRVLYCKLPTNCKQLPAFPLEAVLFYVEFNSQGHIVMGSLQVEEPVYTRWS